MLNYILPPVVIIVGLAILITFLFRKAEKISAEDFALNEKNESESRNSIKISGTIGQWGLKFLEKLMHRAKLMSLKFHNLSNVWFQAIREKRKLNTQIQFENANKFAKTESIVQKVPEMVVKSEKMVYPQKTVLRPTVRQTVTMPQRQARIMEKNKMEEALIKRIAVNPRDIEAYERLGDYYLENENFQDSLECFRQVLKLSPSHIKARMRIRRLERMK